MSEDRGEADLDWVDNLDRSIEERKQTNVKVDLLAARVLRHRETRENFLRDPELYLSAAGITPGDKELEEIRKAVKEIGGAVDRVTDSLNEASGVREPGEAPLAKPKPKPKPKPKNGGTQVCWIDF